MALTDKIQRSFKGRLSGANRKWLSVANSAGLTELRHWRVAGILSLQPLGSCESHRCQAAGGELRSMSTDPHTIGGSGQMENVRRRGSA